MTNFYKKFDGISLTKAQLQKAAKGQPIQVKASQLSGGSTAMYLHPENHSKLTKAKRSSKGTRIHISPYAIQHDLDTLQGASVWSWLKGATKDVYKFGKDNWSLIKPMCPLPLPFLDSHNSQHKPEELSRLCQA